MQFSQFAFPWWASQVAFVRSAGLIPWGPFTQGPGTSLPAPEICSVVEGAGIEAKFSFIMTCSFPSSYGGKDWVPAYERGWLSTAPFSCFFPASKGCLPSAYPPPVGLLSNKKPVASRSIYVWVPFILGEANSWNRAVLAFRSGPVTWS